MKNAHLTSTPIRARLIGLVAMALGITVHVEGFPFGRSRTIERTGAQSRA